MNSFLYTGKLEGGKSSKNLLAIIPTVKKVMEHLIFSVKEMLEANGRADAFSLGSLKQRNLTGSELSSQDLTYDI